jgi:hypothetical protein
VVGVADRRVEMGEMVGVVHHQPGGLCDPGTEGRRVHDIHGLHPIRGRRIGARADHGSHAARRFLGTRGPHRTIRRRVDVLDHRGARRIRGFLGIHGV